MLIKCRDILLQGGIRGHWTPINTSFDIPYPRSNRRRMHQPDRASLSTCMPHVPAAAQMHASSRQKRLQILRQLAHEAAARVTNARHTPTPPKGVRTPIVEKIELQRVITDMLHADGQAEQRAAFPPVLAAFEPLD